jgi:hypothetical protein
MRLLTMTLSNLIPVLDKDQYIYVWFSDDIIGRGSTSTLLRRREINAILNYTVTKVYASNNELHIHTDFK